MQWTLEALKACYTIGATPTKKKLITNFIKNVWNSSFKMCTFLMVGKRDVHPDQKSSFLLGAYTLLQ